MKRRPSRFQVELIVPEEATIADIRDYIEDAVQSWRGQTRPPGSYSDEDPGAAVWHLDPTTVKVTSIRRPRKASEL